jgi:hypothetical protein
MFPSTSLLATAHPKVRSVSGVRVQWTLLLLCIVGYLLLFAIYYPPISAIEDEVGFVNQAIVWSRGSISAESAGYTTMLDFVKINGRSVPWRNPGRSLIILPFIVAGGVRSVFITGALIHIAITLVAALIHQTLGQSPLWALLLLYHPTLGVYSRTIMGDAPAALCLLLCVFVILRSLSPGFAAGLLLGVGALMRYHVLVVLPFLAAALWFDAFLPHPRLESLKFGLSGTAIAVTIGLYNLRLYGSVFGVTEQGYFSARFFLPNLLFYSAALLTIWPGMLAAPLFNYNSISRLAQATCFPILFLFALYYFHDRGSSWLENIILGQRLIQCILPIWIVTYSCAISRTVLPVFRHRLRQFVPGVTAAAILVLVAAQWYTFATHQNHLQLLRAVREEIITHVPPGATIVGNYMVQKLFGIADPRLPSYSWIRLDTVINDPQTFWQSEARPWYCSTVPKGASDESLKDLPRFVDRYRLDPIPTHAPGLRLYSANR